ncbi:MAG: DUF4398 domain-containing protein [Proteobacteria bacterium]|nr:DUF4398 domain-containing protein [Pseudomonadota bacterium]
MTLNLKRNSMITLLVTFLVTACGSNTKPSEDALFEIETRYQNTLNSPVANAAPVEMKFIKEKLALAKQAKADRDNSSVFQLIEQIKGDLTIAKMRAKVNKQNNKLLNQRELISETQMHLLELKEQLK